MEDHYDVVGCRTLFATHFHELAEAAEAMPNTVCMTMDAATGRHDEMFSYKRTERRLSAKGPLTNNCCVTVALERSCSSTRRGTHVA
jgi:hypothetical protein